MTAQGDLLAARTAAPCLVHGDFGGSNLLVRQEAGHWAVAAVLDWEFAFAGVPFVDFGNLLRPPLGDRPGFAAAVAAGYRLAGGDLPEDWRHRSRVIDLFAWLQFLARPDASDALITDACQMVAATIRR